MIFIVIQVPEFVDFVKILHYTYIHIN